MSVCISDTCPYYYCCKKAAVHNPGINTGIDWANYGGGTATVDAVGHSVVHTYNCCGALGDYQLFEAIDGMDSINPGVIKAQPNSAVVQSSDYDTLRITCKQIVLTNDSVEVKFDQVLPDYIQTIVINGVMFHR